MLSELFGKKHKIKIEQLELKLEESTNSYNKILEENHKFKEKIANYNKLLVEYKQNSESLVEKHNMNVVEYKKVYLELEKYKKNLKELNDKIGEYETKIKTTDFELDRYKEFYGTPPINTPSSIGQVNIYDNDKSFFDYIIDITGNPFNEQQIASIRYNMEKHLRIIAGAGSGKTETICAKAAYLKFVKKIDEKEIAMITFTRKAANEMRERVNKFLGVDKSRIQVGTFHNVFSSIYNNIIVKEPSLQRIGIRGGKPKEGELPYNNLLRELISKYNLFAFDKEGEKNISERLSYWTSMGFSKEEIKSLINKHFDKKFEKDGFCLSETFYRMLVEFEQMRKSEKIVIFDDLLLNLYYVLVESLEAREIAQNMYSYIFVDEFQDTNPLQMKILELICPKDNNFSNNKTKLIIVGDDDQSIYAFRASDPSYIKEFSELYTTHTIELMTNYRSVAEIVKAGNRVIAYNKHDRIEKSMIPFHKKNGEIFAIYTKDQKHEADIIIEKCIKIGMKDEPFKLHNRAEDGKPNFTNSVILYRSKSQLIDFIPVLTKRNIPFVIEKTDDLMGIFNYPIFKDFFNSWIKLITSNNWTEIYKDIASNYYIKFSKIREFQHNVRGNYQPKMFMGFLKDNSRSEVKVELIHKYLRYLTELVEKGETNVCELVQLIFEFPKVKKEVDQVQKEEIISTCKDFITWNKLHSYFCKLKKQKSDMEENVEKYHEKKYNALYLLTIHSSKGLAFSNVFIIGSYDGGIPSSKSIAAKSVDMNTTKEKAEPVTTIEEERRLMYVAVTRARNNLYITYPKTINKRPIECSLFLKELNLPSIDLTNYNHLNTELQKS